MRDAGNVCKAWLGQVTRVWWLPLLMGAVSAVAAEAAPFAYVTKVDSSSVSVIDTETNTVVATIPVGGRSWGVAITPDGAFAYVSVQPPDVTCSTPCYISVIDTNPLSSTYNTVVATIPMGQNEFFPGLRQGVAITPDGAFAYVTQDDDVCVAANARCVSVIATATNTTVARVPIPITGNSVPFWIAITPGGAFAYVTNMITDTGTVLVIDTSTNTVVVTVAVGCCPFEVAITPDGAFAYVTNGAPGTVSVIATATNTVVARVMVGSNAIGVAITSDGTRAYVARGGAVSVIETATNTVTATIPVAAGCGGPYGVAITPDGAFAYVAGGGFGCPGVNDVFVIDTNPLSPTYNTVVATVDVGSQPNHVAITP